MALDDGSLRGRLLSESSTRAFGALRDRANASLARIRVVAGAAFCLIAAGLALPGGDPLRINFFALLGYAVASWLVYRWAGRTGWRNRLAAFSPLADVVFFFAVQLEALGEGAQAAFAAGFGLGVFALLVGLSALSLRGRVIAATAAGAFALLAVLQARAGIEWIGIAASGVVLALVGMAAVAVVRELDRLVARLVVNEVSHEELRRAQSEAETLTHLLVHDMKGPLTGLIGLAEVVGAELSGPLKGDVKMIEAQGRRLQTMVGDLLAIARLERGVLQTPPEPVDLSALLRSLSDSYAAAAQRKGAQIAVAVDRGLCATLHRDMVHRLFDNLVLNALDFVRPGGRIEMAARQEGNELLLAVRNTGEPVPPEVRPRLFEKGAQSGSRKGKQNLGLGLYLCRLVAVAHDGTIALAEEPGWAASFVARLPVEASRMGQAIRAAAL